MTPRVSTLPLLLLAASAFDFTRFEAELLPRWIESYRAGPAPGAFSFLPANASSAPTLYGSADVAHVVATTGRAANLSVAEKRAWAATINSFQDPRTGLFTIQPWETAGFQPWHAAAYATAALVLLDARPAAPLTWAIDIAQGGEGVWRSTFLPLLNATAPSCNSIWCMGHEIASYPAALLMTRGRTRDAAFFAWWADDFLAPAVDPATAMWCERAAWAPPNVPCLGGAFHMNFVLIALRVPLSLPETLVRVVGGMQNASTGLWGNDRDPNYIDLDGVYQVVRPAVQMGGAAGPAWAAAQQLCTRFLARAETSLNDPATVLGGVYGSNTHILPGALAGVAECAKAFPSMVRTLRPWVVTLDIAPFI